MTKQFPLARPGVEYLTEGGQETEVMYKHGFELPEFAMFGLLDEPAAFAVLRRMYVGYFETAARRIRGAGRRARLSSQSGLGSATRVVATRAGRLPEAGDRFPA